jgi:hypothetical protein
MAAHVRSCGWGEHTHQSNTFTLTRIVAAHRVHGQASYHQLPGTVLQPKGDLGVQPARTHTVW